MRELTPSPHKHGILLARVPESHRFKLRGYMFESGSLLYVSSKTLLPYGNEEFVDVWHPAENVWMRGLYRSRFDIFVNKETR